MENILEIKDLTIQYHADNRIVEAVNKLNLTLGKGESLGLVGETGAGKTTTALGIMGLIPNPPGIITEGEIVFEGQDLLKLNKKKMQMRRKFDSPYYKHRKLLHIYLEQTRYHLQIEYVWAVHSILRPF